MAFLRMRLVLERLLQGLTVPGVSWLVRRNIERKIRACSSSIGHAFPVTSVVNIQLIRILEPRVLLQTTNRSLPLVIVYCVSSTATNASSTPNSFARGLFLMMIAPTIYNSSSCTGQPLQVIMKHCPNATDMTTTCSTTCFILLPSCSTILIMQFDDANYRCDKFK